MAEPHENGERKLDPWILFALLVFFALGLFAFPGAGRDDAYITYWPAYSLAELGKLANYNGEAVEQSSSLALVLLLALLRAVSGASMSALGWGFGIFSGCVAIVLCARLARGTKARLAPLCLALSAPFVYWSFSGMETSLQAMLVLGWVLSATRNSSAQSPRSALLRVLPWTLGLCAVRPESMFVLGCALAALTVFSRAAGFRTTRPLWIALASSVALLVAARLALFGSWLPQPALAKSGRPLTESLAHGARYLAQHPLPSALTALALVFGGVRLLRAKATPRPALALAGLFVSAQFGFVLCSGGDWMEGARFLAPVLPLSLVLVLDAWPERIPRWTLAAVLAVATLHFATTDSRSLWLGQEPEEHFASEPPVLSLRESRNLVHLRDEPTLIALEQIVASLPTDRPHVVLTGQGGLVLFQLVSRHPGALRIVDRYGLMDRALASSATARAAGSSALGLNLSYRTLLDNWDAMLREAGLPKPDLIFDVGIGSQEARALEARGYVQVYRQAGELIVRSRRQPAKQVVFLARALVSSLPANRLRSFEFTTNSAEQSGPNGQRER